MHVLALRLALSNLKRQPLARLAVVASVACILLMNAMVYLFFKSVSASLAEVRSSRFVTAYLDASIVPAREVDVVSAVRKVPGVRSAQLVSRDAFLGNFSKYFPQLSSELSTLDADTIPRYIKVKVDGDDEASIERQLEQIKGVETVESNKTRFLGLIGALSTLRKLAIALIGGMSTALLCILLNHFKLGSAFQSQMRGTLRVLGAKRRQILLPFAIEGLLEGLAGGLLAAGALVLYGRVFEDQLNELFSAIGYHPYHFQITGVAVALAVIGTSAGMVGSLWAAVRMARQ